MGKFCTNCGQELNENVKFCINCGMEININENQIDESMNSSVNINSEKKNKIVAGLLGIFLGNFGVHNFYLGYNVKGVTQLLITLLSFGTLSIISGTWGLVEGILILTGSINIDGKGNTIQD